MPSASTYHKLPAFDGLEMLDARRHRQPFPWHQHETYNLSLITAGTEAITFPDGSVLSAPAGSLSLTHPRELHANPVLHRLGVSFFTFYLSPDAVAHLAGGRPVRFRHRVVDDPALFGHLLEVAQAGASHPAFETALADGLRQLVARHGCPGSTDDPPRPALVADLEHGLAARLENPLPLEQLARQHGLDRFKLLRLFKRHTGLTPHAYVLMKRVEAAKRLLDQGAPLADAALEVGFYDQAHFSRFFKSFVGVSPGQYRSLPVG